MTTIRCWPNAWSRSRPPSNDLANLLAEAMRRPLADFSHRPQCLYVRARPEWAELLPHLKQIGVKAVAQTALTKWDRNFGDLQAKVERVRAKTGRSGTMARSKKSAEKSTDKVRLYTVEVFILRGPISERFAKKNPVIS